jgi:hypothetical protein
MLLWPHLSRFPRIEILGELLLSSMGVNLELVEVNIGFDYQRMLLRTTSREG